MRSTWRWATAAGAVGPVPWRLRAAEESATRSATTSDEGSARDASSNRAAAHWRFLHGSAAQEAARAAVWWSGSWARADPEHAIGELRRAGFAGTSWSWRSRSLVGRHAGRSAAGGPVVRLDGGTQGACGIEEPGLDGPERKVEGAGRSPAGSIPGSDGGRRSPAGRSEVGGSRDPGDPDRRPPTSDPTSPGMSIGKNPHVGVVQRRSRSASR